jgi:hypothetical protein
MTVISSQRFRNEDIIDEKIEQIENAEYIEVPVVNAYLQDDEGNDLYIIVDKHHTLSAARELGKEVRFIEVEDELSYYKDIEEHNGEAICEAHLMDSNWYYVEHEDEEMIGRDVW